MGLARFGTRTGVRLSISEGVKKPMRYLALTAAVAAVALAAIGTGGAANGHANAAAVCPGAEAGASHCHALVSTDAHGNPDAQASPYGLSPSQIRSAYGFSTSSTIGAGKTIAIV